MKSELPWKESHVLPYIILFFATLNAIFLSGNHRAFGSLLMELRREYTNITLMELNWIDVSSPAIAFNSSGIITLMIFYFKRKYALFQFMGALFVLTSCIASSLIPNPHWLLSTHTIFHGIGTGLIISVIGLVVNEHFHYNHKYHVLATTLISGGPIASNIFGPIIHSLSHGLGWRTALIILGIIYFIIHSIGAMFFKRKEEYNDTLNKSNKKDVYCYFQENLTSIHIPLIVFWSLERFITGFVTHGMLIHLTDYVYKTEKGIFKKPKLKTLFTWGEAIAHIICAVISAITKDFFQEKVKYVLFGTSVVMGFALISLEFFKEDHIFNYTLCFLSGLSLGPSNSFHFLASEELTNLPGHMAYPIGLTGMGLGIMLSPLLTSKIFEIFIQSWFFFALGCLILLKVVSIYIIIIILHFSQIYIQRKMNSSEKSNLPTPSNSNDGENTSLLKNKTK